MYPSIDCDGILKSFRCLERKADNVGNDRLDAYAVELLRYAEHVINFDPFVQDIVSDEIIS